jgi:hypothetical protein
MGGVKQNGEDAACFARFFVFGRVAGVVMPSVAAEKVWSAKGRTTSRKTRHQSGIRCIELAACQCSQIRTPLLQELLNTCIDTPA